MRQTRTAQPRPFQSLAVASLLATLPRLETPAAQAAIECHLPPDQPEIRIELVQLNEVSP